MIQKYSFPTEEKAKELILGLTPKTNNLEEVEQDFTKITVTESTQGIVCLGFQNEYSFNPETMESVLVKEGLTYDVDVFWKVEPNEEWLPFEVNPKTSNHNFS